MRIGSLFAGVGGFDLGFERAGFDVAWCVEKDKHAQAVLRARFPKATIYGDITAVDPLELEKVDVVCGGFPCQDLSVAGRRAGLKGERSGLFFDAMRIVRAVSPRLLVLENVPGMLTSNNGLDFAVVLREVGEGWPCEEIAWRVLDSQFFGVAQRRKRCFVVASSRLGCAEEILALCEGVRGDPCEEPAQEQDASADAEAGAGAGGKWWDGRDTSASLTTKCHEQYMPDKGNFAAVIIDRAAYNQGKNAMYKPKIKIDTHMPALVARGPHAVAIQGNLIGRDKGGPCGVGASDDGKMYTLTKTDVHGVAFPIQDAREVDKRQNGLGVGNDGDPSYTIDGMSQHAVAFRKSRRAQHNGDHETWIADGLANTLNGFDTGDTRTTHIVATPMVVRRLTPVECERLQGFPDGWTNIGTEQKPTVDSHRYKQMGNAVTVNVAEWIARRAHRVLCEQGASDAQGTAGRNRRAQPEGGGL